MEELDLLKKDWQKANAFEQISELEIYKMLHKKSSSVVRWILIISIIEFLLWTSISFFGNSDESFKKINADFFITYFKYITILNYAITAVFIYFFYLNYKNISAGDSTKQLMKDILKTRKTVKYYVWYNLTFVFIFSTISFIMMFTYIPEFEKIESDNKLFMIIICILTIIMFVFLGLIWLFYKLLYGILLKKLNSNYLELKKIEL